MSLAGEAPVDSRRARAPIKGARRVPRQAPPRARIYADFESETAQAPGARRRRRSGRRDPVSAPGAQRCAMPGLQDADVVAALERLRIRAARVAHAAAHLIERGVLVLFGPALEFALEIRQTRRPVLEQRRDDLDRVRAGHDRPSPRRSARARRRSPRARRAAGRRAPPATAAAAAARTNPTGAGAASSRASRVDVGLVEPVEQHEPRGAQAVELPREVGNRRVERRELHRQRNRDRLPQHGDDVDDAALDGEAVLEEIRGDVVEVQLERIRARPLDEPRVLEPALRPSCR